jgi:hypothetical protein
VLQDDIIAGYGVLPFDLLQTHFHLDQLALLLGKVLADLCVAQAQHATHLLRRQSLRQHPSDLLERDAKALECQDAMQPG